MESTWIGKVRSLCIFEDRDDGKTYLVVGCDKANKSSFQICTKDCDIPEGLQIGDVVEVAVSLSAKRSESPFGDDKAKVCRLAKEALKLATDLGWKRDDEPREP